MIALDSPGHESMAWPLQLEASRLREESSARVNGSCRKMAECEKIFMERQDEPLLMGDPAIGTPDEQPFLRWRSVPH